ncbi:MAG: putative rane protein [Daejeonella sp.]|nr:putative rane protein [Daejeonella sp.]
MKQYALSIKIILITLLMLFCNHLQAQQKAMYSQYMFNGLTLNPAYSAADEAFTITSIYRQQWVGLRGSPNTQTFSIHSPIKETNTSVGAILIRDQAGEISSEQGGYLTIAQRVPVGETSYLAAGVNAGISMLRANYSSLYPESPQSVDDPVFQNQRGSSVNFGFGVMLFSSKYFVGFSSPHFYYRPLKSIIDLQSGTSYRSHYILQGGYVMKINENLKFKPYFMANYVNGSPLSMDFSANLLILETVWLGGSYRSFDSFNAIAQVYVTPKLAVGYSYDFSTTEFSKVQSGSHEISLKFRLPVKGREYPRCYF